MSDPYDTLWNRLVEGLHGSNGMNPQSSDESDAAFCNAPEAPLSSQEIEATMEAVLSGELATWDSLTKVDDLADAGCLSEEVFRSRTEDSPDDADRQDILDELKRRTSADDEGKENTEDSEHPNAN